MNTEKVEKKLMKEFGRLIRALRLEQNMSIEEFAYALGVDRTTVDRLENGRNSPNFFTFTRLHMKGKMDINSLLKKAAENTGYLEEIMKENETKDNEIE